MFDRLAKWTRIGVSARVSGYLHRMAPVALGAVLFAAIGLGWPLRGSSIPPVSSSSPAIGTDATADDGELDDFLAMARWGRPVHDTDVTRRDRDATGLNRALAELGVIAISTTADSRAVLLTKPDGQSERLTVGETLPDGRVLVSVAENAVVLKHAAGKPEELILFPRHGEVVVADEAPTDGEGVP